MNIKFDTVEDYFNSLPAKTAIPLKKMRDIIRKAAPGATEKISYNMPSFYLGGNLVYYAAFSNHISLFPHAKAIEIFKNELINFKTSKGTIQFSLEKPLPVTLIKKIVSFRVSEMKKKEVAKASAGLKSKLKKKARK